MKNRVYTIAVTALITFILSGFLYLGVGKAALPFAAQTNSINTAKLKEIEKYIDSEYLGKIDKQKLSDGSAYGLVAALDDPYSIYLTKDDYADMLTDLQSEYKGVGVTVTVDPKDNLITVMGVFDDSPAQKAGIQINDKIIKVDDYDASGENYSEVINYMRGKGLDSAKAAMPMTIKILRGGEELVFSVPRDKVNKKTVYYEEINNIGYIRISDFEDNTANEFKEIVNNIDRSRIKGIVLDLRNNPGGVFDAAVKICDTLLPKGLIVYTQDKNGNRRESTSDASELGLPLSVLVNGNSASASEIVAGAIKDFGKGRLIGNKTFGKGVVQHIYPLSDGSAVKLTTEYYYTPSGVCINKTGIEPDIVVDLPSEYASSPISSIPHEKDTQLQKAIEVLAE